MIRTVSSLCLVILMMASSYIVGFSQPLSSDRITHQITRIFPPISLAPAQAKDINTLMDISPYYKPSWVKEYKAVKVTGIVDNKIITRTGHSHNLTKEQRQLINTSDEATEIQVSVEYIPDNSLSHNDSQVHDFVFSIDPHSSAYYIAGEDQLAAQLQTKVIDHLDPTFFQGYALAAITFTVDQDGHVMDARIAASTDDMDTDKTLLDAICHMTGWAPAQFASGLKTEQKFVWLVGNEESCKMNFFNTRRKLPEPGE